MLLPVADAKVADAKVADAKSADAKSADTKRASPVVPDSSETASHGLTSGLTLTTQLAIAMILLVAITVSAAGYFGYRSVEQVVLPRVLDRIETHSRFVAADLESRVRTAPGDVTTFANLAAVAGLMRARLNGGIDPEDHTTEAIWRERLESPARRSDGASSRPIRCG